jgi:hypothetical protein
MPDGMRHAGWIRKAAGGFLPCLIASGCLSAPRPTEEAIRRQANPRAVVEGIVRDERGGPVEGIVVIGLPRDRDLTWSGPARSDASGRFRLSLIAPGVYGFLLSWNGVSVITKSSSDPSRLRIALVPGEKRDGLELTWLRPEWEATLAESGQKLSPTP